MTPQFPAFRSIQLEDRDVIQEILWSYKPQTSELTFTNLFIWRTHYGFQWSMYKDWLMIICSTATAGFYALQPIGPSPRLEPIRALFAWFNDEKGENSPRIERADERMIGEIAGTKDLSITPTREHFDYLYRTEELAGLHGNKYHSKRNHINNFVRSNAFHYDILTDNYLKSCLELTERWCGLRRCEEDLNLLGEWDAIGEALANYHDLHLHGAVIEMNGNVEAFTCGELLNENVAVIHIEKANPEISGLYAAINQKFVENSWHGVKYINREQDLGEPGLRQVKISYHPDHFVEKYRIQLSGHNN